MPTELVIGLGLLTGLFIGAGMAWAIVASREKASRATALGLAGMRTAAAEALEQETRQQLALAKNESTALGEKLEKYRAAWTTAKTRLEETEKNLKEQRALLDQAELKLTETFKSVAAQALAMNNKGFLILAEENFKGIKQEATADLEARKVAIAALMKPVSETLVSYQKETKELEAKRLKEIGAVGEQLRTVAETQVLLHTETSRLVNALKSPQVRGRWGEIVLQRTAELAGMTPYCDFVVQESQSTEAGRIRPDMVVKLPERREVVVDSKVPLGGFMEAIEAHTEEQRNLALDKHAKQVKKHVDTLSAKEYWGQFPSTPEFVVLFIPNDSFLAAAAERDPDLIEYALKNKIVIATPSTFIALLRAIEHGWRQQKGVENALVITKLGQELSERFGTLVEHLRKIGGALGKAMDSYNAAVGSFEHQLLPSARRFKDLGAVGRKEIEKLELVDKPARPLANSDEENNGED